ncbi:MAG: TolC family protein [Planctomycetota bacterium]|jgi:cobalt-zinc-cadmium efflux system outer membrane protein
MLYRKFIFVLPLAVILVMGCTEQYNTKLHQTNYDDINNVHITSFSEFPDAQQQETSQISEPNGVLTLSQALALALMKNPELKAFSLQIRVSQARELQAGLWPNPALDVEVEEVGGTGQRSGFDAAETTIQLSQLIELGDKRTKRRKLASLEKELAGSDYEAKRLDVFTEVTISFIEVLAAQHRLGLTEELLQLSEELLDAVTKRVEAGKDSPLEKTKAAVALSNIKIQHQKAVQNLEFARKQLASTWTGKEPVFKSVAGQLDPDQLPPIPSIDELTVLTAQNPDITRWSLEIDQKKAALELEKAKAISDVTLNGGLRRFNDTDDNAIVFGVSIPVPISDRNQAGKLAAAYNLARAREEQRAAHIRIQMELARAYQALAIAYTEAAELDKNVLRGAESVFEASKTGYTQGKLDYLNVLDAQRTLFKAKAQYIDALASCHTAKADVERLIGRSIDSEALSQSEDRK